MEEQKTKKINTATTFLKIESKGAIDTKAFSLIGASTKRGDDTKIGFFGSGLKYSIAFLLRNKIPFKVFSDYKQIKFKTKTESFREQKFDVIYINGKETSMTTNMGGEEWTQWSIVREIYCNAIDEGESAISVVKESGCVPLEDKTVFYIKVTPEFQKIINEWDLYFSENRKDLLYSDVNGNQFYIGGEKLIVYRKGIRCHFTKEEKPIFHYDMQWIEINESRTIKDDWNFKYTLRTFLQKVKDRKIISQIISLINSRWERCLNWNNGAKDYSDMWLEVINKRVLVPTENAGFWQETIELEPLAFLILPQNMIEGLKDRFLDDVRVIGEGEGSKSGEFKVMKELTKKQEYMLGEAQKFLAEAGYEIKFPIKVVEFVAKERLGQALDNEILLSTKLLERGAKQIVECLVEENEHIITGYGDNTREFQSHFIGKYVSSMEDKIGKFL